MKAEICSQIEAKKAGLFSLSYCEGERETTISNKLYTALSPWDFKNINYSGLFGWTGFHTDKYVELPNGRAVIEVKKVVEEREYGYWHGLVQSLIYRFKEGENGYTGNLLFLCIVLDWGRKLGVQLDEQEKRFLSQYIDLEIYFVRICMSNPPFMEHNLKDEWEILN